jgi:signal transduction histidine kinase
LAWSGLATAVGIAVKNQRAVVAAAVERAERAEQSREEEADRRVEQERLHIARELHDVVAHHISIINVQSGVALHLIDSRPELARESIGHVRDSSQEVMREMSTLLGLLRTTEDGSQIQPAPGLAQLSELVESMRRTGLHVTLNEQGRPYTLSPLVDLTAYRTVQESLTNAHKHGTGTADVRLRYGQATVTIEVENPIADDTRVREPLGHGLVGMRERVVAVGGQIDVGPTGRGTFAVHVEIPTREPHITSPEVAQ